MTEQPGGEASASSGQENLEMVMIDFFGTLRRGDFEAAVALLDPWQGLSEDWVCQGRDEVMETFRWALVERRDIDALEFTRGGERVVLGVRGPSITETGGEPLAGQIFNVSPCTTAGSCASMITATATRPSPPPASSRTRAGNERANVKRIGLLGGMSWESRSSTTDS